MVTDVVRFHLSCVPPTANHQRKRIVRIKLKDGRSFTKLADKPELLAAKSTLDELLVPHQRPEPVIGSVVLTLVFTWPWLKGHSKRFRAPGRQPHTSKPDLSNAIKTLEDRLVALRFLEDDRAVAELHVQKWWGDVPGIDVMIQPFGERPVLQPRTREHDLFAVLEANA